jgi:hypothetical protein
MYLQLGSRGLIFMKLLYQVPKWFVPCRAPPLRSTLLVLKYEWIPTNSVLELYTTVCVATSIFAHIRPAEPLLHMMLTSNLTDFLFE